MTSACVDVPSPNVDQAVFQKNHEGRPCCLTYLLWSSDGFQKTIDVPIGVA